ncbi:(p)ppGpp synthase/HD superfamily hydrolase [Arthrobacter sp. CAN_A214]|uniref:phosphohydrolase n=1 Tax=Arthrobacter sp. CAN_A214 TaxID=2787720 RepID=UPI0018C9629C
MSKLIAQAEQVARAAHEGQTDKAGVPYIGHPERVARTASQTAPAHLAEQATAVGWLHDAVEDTGVTIDQLRTQGFPEAVIAGVEAMTKRKGESIDDYFARVRSDELARIVKAADIDDNTNPERVRKLDARTQARLAAKYEQSRALLALDLQGVPVTG